MAHLGVVGNQVLLAGWAKFQQAQIVVVSMNDVGESGSVDPDHVSASMENVCLLAERHPIRVYGLEVPLVQKALNFFVVAERPSPRRRTGEKDSSLCTCLLTTIVEIQEGEDFAGGLQKLGPS